MLDVGALEADLDVSVACGERKPPPVRRSAPDTIILADGFSCREQIRQASRRRALHLAEILGLALVADLRSTPA